MYAIYKVIARSEDDAYDKLSEYYEVVELIEQHDTEYVFKVFTDPSVGGLRFQDKPDDDISIVHDESDFNDEFEFIKKYLTF